MIDSQWESARTAIYRLFLEMEDGVFHCPAVECTKTQLPVHPSMGELRWTAQGQVGNAMD